MGKSGFENGQRVAVSDPEEVVMDPDRIAELQERGGHETPDYGRDFSKKELELIEGEVERRLFSAQADVLRAVLFLLLDAKKPKRRIYQMLYAAGMGAACGGSATAIAKRLGITKQAFEQGADRDLRTLFMRKNPLGKKDGAGAAYAAANYRHNGAPELMEEK